MNRTEITEEIVAARLTKGLTWQELADAIKRPVVWTTSALLGQQPIPAELAEVLVDMLGLGRSAVPVLAAAPMRGGLDTADRVVVTFDGKFLPYAWDSASDR